MPRVKRTSEVKTSDEKLIEIGLLIEDKKREISELKVARKKLMKKKEDADMEAVFAAVKSSGKSSAVLIELIQNA